MTFSPVMREKFWNFNVGHLLTILMIAGGLLSIYATAVRSAEQMLGSITAHEKQFAYFERRLDAQAKLQEAQTEALARIDKTGTTKSGSTLANDHANIIELQGAVKSLDLIARQIPVMANEIGWIKSELIRRKNSNE